MAANRMSELRSERRAGFAMIDSRTAISEIRDTERGPAPSLLRVADLRKSYGATQALRSCNIDIAPGEIRALLGENGSGKSTLVKILSGVVRADAGSVELSEMALSVHSPREAQARGVVTVFQETLVAPDLSVLDNIFLGSDRTFRWGRPQPEQRRIARQALDALGASSIKLDSPVSVLPLHRRQLVTLARAVARPWRLLILDEATSALDVESRDALFRFLRQNRPAGSAVLFISHRMDEIAALAHSVTVLQSGETTATLAIADASVDRLIEMISQSHDGGRPKTPRSKPARGTPAAPKSGPRLRAQGVVLRSGGSRIDLEAKSGEIFGFSGLDGHGQAEFLATLAGLNKKEAGTVETLHDGAWRPIATLREAVRNGVCYVPRDRKSDGLFLGLSVLDNYGLPTLWREARLSFINRAVIRARAKRDLAVLRTRYSSLSGPVARLSGGNQQKVLLARWLATGPAVMILDDPLRGVDAATKGEIYDVFRDLAGNGVTLLLLSTEIEELITCCDRAAVFRESEVSAVLEGAELTREAIVAAMFGLNRQAARESVTEAPR
jgi:ribose transport system ATP-binding protein